MRIIATNVKVDDMVQVAGGKTWRRVVYIYWDNEVRIMLKGRKHSISANCITAIKGNPDGVVCATIQDGEYITLDTWLRTSYGVKEMDLNPEWVAEHYEITDEYEAMSFINNMCDEYGDYVYDKCSLSINYFIDPNDVFTYIPREENGTRFLR